MNYKIFISATIFLCFITLLQNCKDPNISSSSQLSEPSVANNNESAEKSGLLITREIPSTLSDWVALKELAKLITDISNENHQALEESEESLSDLFSALVVKIPDPVNKSSITTRIKVLETLAYKLTVEYSINQNNSIEFENTKIDLAEAYSNLMFQIYKTLEKESQLISKPK